MTHPDHSVARRLLFGLTATAVITLVLAATAFAATTTTAGTPTTTATTPAAAADASATTTTAADASSGATTGGTQSAAVVTPPPAGFTPLNPGVKVPTVAVQIWPEYDTRDVLVFMNLTLPAGTALPATFTYVVPTGARLAGIGEVDPNGNFTYSYTSGPPPTTVGQDGTIVTITLKRYLRVQVEWYYNPGVATTGARSFPVSVVIPVDTDKVEIAVQQPLRSTNFSVEPPMGQPVAGGDGFNYVSGTLPALKAGSKITTTIAYTKTDSEPSNSTAVSTPAQKSTSKLLIYILIALVVVVAGFSVYRLWLRPAFASSGGGGTSGGGGGRGGSGGQSGGSGRGSQGSRGSGASRGGPGKSTSGSPSVRADAGGSAPAKFCTNCGARLAKRDRFCPECGHERES